MTTLTPAVSAHEKIQSFIRTKVAFAVGAFLGWLLLVSNLDLTGAFALTLTAFGIALVTNGYYLLIRLLESRFPWLGVLLGWPKQPVYFGVDDLWASLVKTAIPTVAAFLVALGLNVITNLTGFDLFPDPENQLTLVIVLIGAFEAAYDSAAKWIIAKVPRASWLLGTGAPLALYTSKVA